MTARREFTAAQRSEIFTRCRGRCIDCGSAAGPFDFEHDKPVWLGGKSVVANGVLRCRGRDGCHARKTRREATARAKTDRIRRRLAGEKIGNHQARNRRQRRHVKVIELPF
jgi:hypothetical protein